MDPRSPCTILLHGGGHQFPLPAFSSSLTTCFTLQICFLSHRPSQVPICSLLSDSSVYIFIHVTHSIFPCTFTPEHLFLNLPHHRSLPLLCWYCFFNHFQQILHNTVPVRTYHSVRHQMYTWETSCVEGKTQILPQETIFLPERTPQLGL